VRSRITLTIVAACLRFADAAPVPVDDLRGEARRLEHLGRWEQAADIYLQLLADDRAAADARERLQHCTRRLHQARRHADPAVRDKLLALPVPQALALYGEVLDKLHTQYVDADRVPYDALYRHGLDEVRYALAEPAFRRAYLAGVEPAALVALTDRLRDEVTRLPADAREVRVAARSLALDAQRLAGVPAAAVVLELACGAAGALDEYTLFLSPGQPLDDPAAVGGDLGALGLGLALKDKALAVERVAIGSWAAATGFQAGDRVTHVGRAAVADLTPDAVAELLKGDLTTLGELTVATVTGVTRILSLPGYPPSVPDADMLKDGIGYVRLALFHRHTPLELESALLRLRAEGMRVLVLDLRGNPGGLFSVAVQVAERFLPAGVIVTTESRRGPKTFAASNPMGAFELPVVALIDGDTASAAEVVAGALKDNNRATLVGQTTFGKGSVQKLFHLQAGSGLKLTLAHFYTPRGRPLGGVGVSPHVEVRREGMKDTALDAALEQATRLLTMK
jgi:carboxyl-terminal processing protease